MKKQLDTRWRVVLELQQRLEKLKPGSDEANILEHAISLAINSTSQEPNHKFFRHDILRNARFIYWRSKTRQLELMQKVTHTTSTWTQGCEMNAGLELEEKLREVITKSGKGLMRYFEGMINGESVDVTAVACGVSRRTVDRRRRKVRQIVQSFLDESEKAA